MGITNCQRQGGQMESRNESQNSSRPSMPVCGFARKLICYLEAPWYCYWGFNSREGQFIIISCVIFRVDVETMRTAAANLKDTNLIILQKILESILRNCFYYLFFVNRAASHSISAITSWLSKETPLCVTANHCYLWSTLGQLYSISC